MPTPFLLLSPTVFGQPAIFHFRKTLDSGGEASSGVPDTPRRELMQFWRRTQLGAEGASPDAGRLET